MASTTGRVARFPDFDVLAQAKTWDTRTRAVVLDRIDAPEIRFFSPAEARTASALFDRLLAQDGEPRVPIAALVDARLADNDSDGYRYCDMPDDRTAWRMTLAALNADASAGYACAFAELSIARQRAVIHGVQRCSGQWHGLPAPRVFGLWMRYACAAFYSHPAAWNEIGFGGPAYPRGYKNLGLDRREPWEVADARPLRAVR